MRDSQPWPRVGAAVAWGVAVFGVVKPFLRTGVTYDTDTYYAWLGGGLGVLRVPFERADELIAVLSRPAGWIVALWLLLGLGGLGFLRPRWLVLLVPPLIVHLLSSQILPFDAAGAYILVDRRPFVTGRFPWTDRAAFIARIESSERPLLRDDGRFRLWGPLGE